MDNILMENMIYLLIFILFFMLMFYFVSANNNRASFWEDFYAKEIALLIDNSEPGTSFSVDVSELSRVAIKNKIDVGRLISVNNLKNTIIVSTRHGEGTSFGFFNDVDVVFGQEEGIGFSSDEKVTTQFKFTLKEKQKNE